MLKILVSALLLGATTSPPPTTPSVTVPVLEVAGADRTVALTPELLHQLPRIKTSVSATEHNAAGTFEGVALRTILSQAGVPAGHDIRGEYLCWIVTLEAADGYKVVFALAELDPDFTSDVVLLADTRDGKALDAKEAPLRLVAPAQKRPARWIRQVIRITAGSACNPQRPAA